MKYLIVNADDFGAGCGINRGIAESATSGIVTSASLMVNMPGTAAAVMMRGDLPISVGLHVNLTNEGKPIVDLDDETACEDEMRAQFRRFQDLTGELPTHLDAHHNVHRRRNLLAHFRRLASEYGIPLRENSAVRYFPDFYGQWNGETHPEQIGIENLVRMLGTEIREGVTELSCHPGYMAPDFQSEYGCEREMELRALCAPVLPGVLHDDGIELINYRRLREIEEALRNTNHA